MEPVAPPEFEITTVVEFVPARVVQLPWRPVVVPVVDVVFTIVIGIPGIIPLVEEIGNEEVDAPVVITPLDDGFPIGNPLNVTVPCVFMVPVDDVVPITTVVEFVPPRVVHTPCNPVVVPPVDVVPDITIGKFGIIQEVEGIGNEHVPEPIVIVPPDVGITGVIILLFMTPTKFGV
jgi:hypothetical protein